MPIRTLMAVALLLCAGPVIVRAEGAVPRSPVVKIGDISDRGHGSAFYIGSFEASAIGVTLGVYHDLYVTAGHADFFNDFAIIASRSPEHPTAPLSLDCGAVPAPGTPISAVGFPFDLPEIHTQGHVAAKPVPWGDWPEIIFTDITIGPGNSGGPAIGEDGRVVGVMVGWLPPTGISGMIPMRRICDWLQIAPKAGP